MWFLFKLSNKLFFIKGKIICLRVLSLLKKPIFAETIIRNVLWH